MEGDTAEAVAAKYRYKISTVYTLARDFKVRLTACRQRGEDPFFQILKPGRKKLYEEDDELVKAILSFRKKHLSIPDIKIILDGKGYNVSESFIYNVCDKDGFVRLPKRGKSERLELMGSSGYAEVLQAPESEVCTFAKSEKIASNGVGVLCFLPFIKAYGIDEAIEKSSWSLTASSPHWRIWAG